MKSLIESWKNIWGSIHQSPAQIPSRITMPRDHIDEGEKLGVAFQPDEYYFQVRVNEMYLTYGREWFSKYDPMVFVVSEFTYDEKVEAVPFVVGPMMMEKYGMKIPTGMIFSNTRVAGLHPYRGGRLTLSVVLYRIQRENYARKLLQIVESAASALDFSTALSSYVKIASVVLDGVEALLGLGHTTPLIGLRKEFDPDADDILEPNYFALIDMPESELDANKLWVRDHQLIYGKSLAAAEPFREADFVLYSITQTPERSDETNLPFYPLYERVKQEATVPEENSWKRAKSNLLTLYQTLVLSPDLTRGQADKLNKKYIDEIKQLHETVVNMSTLGVEKEAKELSEVESKLRQAVNILDL
jgi:hypothetical protein